ncbi:MAG: hypothetical protein A3K83_01690 [Omnitrophica WOR_2 bacterium RBG_13_44_8b]|nr:MAG: hypothetical protein A3K83_01690 [Omnitrophica WOR_2 bacterium RBG_13_44_8b]
MLVRDIKEKMNRRINILIGLTVVLLAIAASVNFQFPVFTSKYIVKDDVRQHIYWMQQFRDSDLFRNDLLTEYAKSYQPWGFIAVYYLLSFFIDPIVASKIMPIILVVLSSVYIFKLVRHIVNGYTGFLAALILMMTPHYLDRMTGGLPRSFAFPLVIMFLYYLIKRRYLQSSVILVLQSLFYPMICLISIPTYLCTFIRFENNRIFFDRSVVKKKFLIYAIVISAFILCAKYALIYNPSIGTTVSRGQMVGDPAYYESGRYRVLQTAPLPKMIAMNVNKGVFLPKILRRYFPKAFAGSGKPSGNAVFFIAVLFVAYETLRKRLVFPPEIFFMFLSSMLMYLISDMMLFKLFLPERYLEYTVPVISLTVYSVAVGQLINRFKNAGMKNTFQVALIILVLFHYDIHGRDRFLADKTDDYKGLYEYLNSLPKDAMIAVHPSLGNSIPSFAQRKVFINYELSHPFYDKYWAVIKKRTYDFFNAYYAGEALPVLEFCEDNGIDYLVVDKQHFADAYLSKKKIYFEPFNSYVVQIAESRRNFILRDIPDEEKLFKKGSIFVIKKDSLKKLIPSEKK